MNHELQKVFFILFKKNIKMSYKLSTQRFIMAKKNLFDGDAVIIRS